MDAVAPWPMTARSEQYHSRGAGAQARTGTGFSSWRSRRTGVQGQALRKGCAHHQHEEGSVRLHSRRRSGQSEGIRLGLKALRARAHRVAAQCVKHLLDAWPLRPVLADAAE